MPAVIFEQAFLLAEVEIPVKMVTAGFRRRRVSFPTETKAPRPESDWFFDRPTHKIHGIAEMATRKNK